MTYTKIINMMERYCMGFVSFHHGWLIDKAYEMKVWNSRALLWLATSKLLDTPTLDIMSGISALDIIQKFLTFARNKYWSQIQYISWPGPLEAICERRLSHQDNPLGLLHKFDIYQQTHPLSFLAPNARCSRIYCSPWIYFVISRKWTI